MSGKRIGLKEVRALGPGETIWDAAVPSFGARRQKGPAIAYVLKFRTTEGRQRWHTIGRHGAPWTPEMAREEARRLLGEVVRGVDPSSDKTAKRTATTVAELCGQYFTDAEAGRLLTRRKASKKPSTLLTDKGRIQRHIIPLLGRLSVPAVSRGDIETFLHAVAEGKTAGRTKTAKKRGLAHVRGGKGTASRTVGLLGAIVSYAVRTGMRPDNPVHGVIRFADGMKKRRLSDDEYRMLGKALREAEAADHWPYAIEATRFLVMTGWRSGEVLGLLWSQIDIARQTATLPDTKTGHSMRPLSGAVCDILRRVPSTDGLVFRATRGTGPMTGFRKMWDRIAKLGPLPDDVTPHVFRHSFSSLASDMGYSEPTIAAMVGHKGRTMTSRYVHSADAVLLAAADVVTNKTALLMGEAESSPEVKLQN